MQHFANFAYNRTTGEGFGATKNSFGTQSQTGKDAQWLMKNDREGYENYKRQAAEQSAKLRENAAKGLNQNNQNLPQQQVTKNINQQVVKNLNTQSPVAEVKGFWGKAKNTAGRYGKAAAGLGGVAMTGMYVLPMLGGLLPQGQQPEQEPPY